MRFIPTFILEHWLYKPHLFELFVRAGKLYGRNLPKVDEETDIYMCDFIHKTWIKISKEKEI